MPNAKVDRNHTPLPERACQYYRLPPLLLLHSLFLVSLLPTTWFYSQACHNLLNVNCTSVLCSRRKRQHRENKKKYQVQARSLGAHECMKNEHSDLVTQIEGITWLGGLVRWIKCLSFVLTIRAIYYDGIALPLERFCRAAARWRLLTWRRKRSIVDPSIKPAPD